MFFWASVKIHICVYIFVYVCNSLLFCHRPPHTHTPVIFLSVPPLLSAYKCNLYVKCHQRKTLIMSLTLSLSAKIATLHVTLLIYSLCCECVLRDAPLIGNTNIWKTAQTCWKMDINMIVMTFALTVPKNEAKCREVWPLYKILTSTH